MDRKDKLMTARQFYPEREVANTAGMTHSVHTDTHEEKDYDDEVPLKVCMAISARKRYLEDLEMSDSDQEKGEPGNKKCTEDFGFKCMDNTTNVPVDEHGFCRIESAEEKRTRIELEHAKLGIPFMTFVGPSAGSVQPKSGAVRIYDFDWNCIPMRVTDMTEVQRDGHLFPIVEHFNITKEYRDWYQKALLEMFPRTQMEPRIVETIYGAKVKLLQFFNSGTAENRQVLMLLINTTQFRARLINPISSMAYKP